MMSVLPEADRSRSLMRAAEQQAIYDLQTRMDGLDHSYCEQLAESESSLLVEIEDAIRSHAGSSAVTTPKARELLRAPLDALAGRVRGLLVKHGTDEAEAIKRALAGLASDLTAVHEQELRRLRESLNHAKRLAEAQNERIRRSMKTQLLQIRDNLRRDYSKRIEEAQEKQREAETAAAAAAERHPTLDTQALLEERVALRLQVESLTKQLQEHESESKQTITHQSEARTEAERRAAFARRCLDEQTEKLTQVTDDLRAAILAGRRQSEEYATSQSALRQAQAQLESLRMKMIADREAQRMRGASSAPPPHQLGSLSRSSSSHDFGEGGDGSQAMRWASSLRGDKEPSPLPHAPPTRAPPPPRPSSAAPSSAVPSARRMTVAEPPEPHEGPTGVLDSTQAKAQARAQLLAATNWPQLDAAAAGAPTVAAPSPRRESAHARAQHDAPTPRRERAHSEINSEVAAHCPRRESANSAPLAAAGHTKLVDALMDRPLTTALASALTISGNVKLNTALGIDWERLPESWREALLSLSDAELEHPPDTWPPELRELVLSAQQHPPSDSSAVSSYLTHPPRLSSATASHPSSVLSHSARPSAGSPQRAHHSALTTARPSAGSARNAVSEVRAASVRAVSAPPCSAPARETPSHQRPYTGPYTAAGAHDSAGTLRDRLRMVAESSPRGGARAAQAAALSAKLSEMALEGVAVGSSGERSARSASHSFTPALEPMPVGGPLHPHSVPPVGGGLHPHSVPPATWPDGTEVFQHGGKLYQDALRNIYSRTARAAQSASHRSEVRLGVSWPPALHASAHHGASSPQVRLGVSRVAAVSRTPCATVPVNMRATHDSHAPAPPATKSLDGRTAMAAMADEWNVRKPTPMGSGAPPSRHGGLDQRESTQTGEPPLSLVEQMRLRSAALEALVDVRTGEAMKALAASERSAVQRSVQRSEATQVVAAAAEMRRRNAADAAPSLPTAPMDVYHIAEQHVQQQEQARPGEKRIPKTVGLNFVR